MFRSQVKDMKLLNNTRIACMGHDCLAISFVSLPGIPIYNVIALTHTPLVIKPNTLKRNRRSRQPEQDKTIKPSDVQSHDKLNEPPPKKLKPSDDKCFTVDHETCEVVKQASNVSNGSSASTNRKWRKWFLLSKGTYYTGNC